MASNIKIAVSPVNAKLSSKNIHKQVKKEFILEGLGCAHCAVKIEQKVNELDEIHSANVNFMAKTLTLEIKENNSVEELMKTVTNIVANIESKVKVIEKVNGKILKKEILLKGLCCGNCAAKIERESNNIDGVKTAVVDFISTKLTMEIEDSSKQNDIIDNVKKIVKRIEPNVNVVVIDSKDSKLKNNEVEKESNKSEIIRLAIGALIFGIATAMKFSNSIELVLYLISYVLVGGEVVLGALRNISRGQVFDENFLMSIATIGAFAIGEYPEGVAVMLFYQIGEMFQDMAVNRSRKSISALMDIRPDFANLKINGEIKKVDPEEVRIGDVIVVKPGEKVPLDGKVIEGNSMVDTAALTGESVPREAGIGDNILSGVINKNGLLTIEVEKEFGDSTVAKILDLVQNASSKKAPTENFITKFARYYTPAIVFAALALAVIPPLVIEGGNIYRMDLQSIIIFSCILSVCFSCFYTSWFLWRNRWSIKEWNSC